MRQRERGDVNALERNSGREEVYIYVIISHCISYTYTASDVTLPYTHQVRRPKRYYSRHPRTTETGYGASSTSCNVARHEIRHGINSAERVSGRAFLSITVAVPGSAGEVIPYKSCKARQGPVSGGHRGMRGCEPFVLPGSRGSRELLPDRKQLHSSDYVAMVGFSLLRSYHTVSSSLRPVEGYQFPDCTAVHN